MNIKGDIIFSNFSFSLDFYPKCFYFILFFYAKASSMSCNTRVKRNSTLDAYGYIVYLFSFTWACSLKDYSLFGAELKTFQNLSFSQTRYNERKATACYKFRSGRVYNFATITGHFSNSTFPKRQPPSSPS